MAAESNVDTSVRVQCLMTIKSEAFVDTCCFFWSACWHMLVCCAGTSILSLNVTDTTTNLGRSYSTTFAWKMTWYRLRAEKIHRPLGCEGVWDGRHSGLWKAGWPGHSFQDFTFPVHYKWFRPTMFIYMFCRYIMPTQKRYHICQLFRSGLMRVAYLRTAIRCRKYRLIFEMKLKIKENITPAPTLTTTIMKGPLRLNLLPPGQVSLRKSVLEYKPIEIWPWLACITYLKFLAMYIYNQLLRPCSLQMTVK